MPLVFISYNRKDGKYAKSLRDQIAARGIDVFLDIDSIAPSVAFPMATAESIAKCDLFLLLWSHNAAASHFVQEELNIALAKKKVIFPVLLDDCPRPAALSAINSMKNVTPVRVANRVVGVVIGKEVVAPERKPRNTLLLRLFLAFNLLLLIGFGIWKFFPVSPIQAATPTTTTESVDTNTVDTVTPRQPDQTSRAPLESHQISQNLPTEKPIVKIDTIAKKNQTDKAMIVKPTTANVLQEPMTLSGKIYLEVQDMPGLEGIEIYATIKGERILIPPTYTLASGAYRLVIPAGSPRPDRIWIDGRDVGYEKTDFPILTRTTDLDYPLKELK